ncbi:DsrE family protein [Massilia sp. YIM B02443]|uniref:DsrE family protein n=1 Tax=Massilia sp. YIM B02443 TaxID=3050127 RepID=UPI0025B6443B|nr:DsrE family protein [Massilia sp. YIM B02443]MDN4036529.1 DsrE family protein [Massilia sp. YIM B02443]
MARLIVVVNDVDDEGAAVPLRYAATAAALDVEVELHCVGASVAWLRQSAAGPALLGQLRDALEAGARIYACPQALAANGVSADALAPEVAGIRGAAALLAAGFAPGARFMNF